jgi:hypothetical protein
MSGYAAAARIRRVSPRFIGADPVDLRSEALDTSAGPVAVIVTSPDDVIAPPPAPLGERLEAARERWAQLTFYLTDPNSWR